MSLTTLVLAALAATSPETVGIATADGGFRIAGIAVPGTGSVTDGSVVETDARPAHLQLRGGATIRLGAQSRARVHADRMYLEEGSSTVTGRLSIFNAEGVLVARTWKAPVSFHAPPAPSSSTELTGLIESKDGVLVIHDEASQLSFPLDATGEAAQKLTDAIGSKAKVKGVLRSGRVEVTSVEALAVTAAAAGTAAATTAASTAAGTATATSAATAATVGISKAVIAGVAIAGAAATGATVGFVQAQSEPSSTVSQ